MTAHRATLIGMLEVIFWSFAIGLIREVSQHLGEYSGPALMYTLITVIMCFISGVPRWRRLSKSYLLWGAILCRHRIVPIALHRLCSERSPDHRSRHDQLPMAESDHFSGNFL